LDLSSVRLIALIDVDPSRGLNLADPQSLALKTLLGRLSSAGYTFIAPTPETHARVLDRLDRGHARDVRDVFGWSLPFSAELLDDELVALMVDAGVLAHEEEFMRSTVRVASLADDLFLHSKFPTTQADSVFFGPDTYRFVNFIRENLPKVQKLGRLVDVGAGSGAGAVAAARVCKFDRIILTDINPQAIAFARINLAVAGVRAEFRLGRGLAGLEGPLDLVIANPPFIADAQNLVYRDGGDLYGARVSLDWALAGAGALSPSGTVLLYTGAAIIGGEDQFRTALQSNLDPQKFMVTYGEIDPDIHSETLSSPAYAGVERIAAVGVIITRRRGSSQNPFQHDAKAVKIVESSLSAWPPQACFQPQKCPRLWPRAEVSAIGPPS